jgi:hypothetical protein
MKGCSNERIGAVSRQDTHSRWSDPQAEHEAGGWWGVGASVLVRPKRRVPDVRLSKSVRLGGASLTGDGACPKNSFVDNGITCKAAQIPD